MGAVCLAQAARGSVDPVPSAEPGLIPPPGGAATPALQPHIRTCHPHIRRLSQQVGDWGKEVWGEGAGRDIKMNY